MYLEIDEGFLEHPKTLQLCATMGDPLAFGYLLRFWRWACRSCKDGDLSGLSEYVIEEAAKYHQHDGKLFRAMAAKLGGRSGFIDVDETGAPLRIHNWEKLTGGAIARMDAKVKSNKERREAARIRNTTSTDAGTMPELCRHDAGQTRPDKTSPDQTRQEDSPRARSNDNANESKVRPRDPQKLLNCLGVAVRREQPQVGLYAPARFDYRDAQKFLANLGDVEAALPDVERKIELFAKDPDMQPWTIAKFVDKYNSIGLPKLEFGRAPKPATNPTSTPIREW